MAYGNMYDPGWQNAALGGKSTFNFEKMLGTVSKGLNLMSGMFQAADWFAKASAQTGSYRALRRRAYGVRERYYQTARDMAEEGHEVLGEMTAGFGTSGSLMEGSPLLTMLDTTRKIERNVQRTVQQGDIEFEQMMYEAKQMKKAAKSAKTMGTISAISSVVGALK